MTTLRDLIPLLRELEQKRKEQADACFLVNRALRPHGFSLYWDDVEERYCIYALPQTLDGTYQFQDEEAQDADYETAWAAYKRLEPRYSRTSRMLAKEEHEETPEQWEADMARDCFLARNKPVEEFET